jgi:hypothetical protein
MMWDRENPYEMQFLPGESCFRMVDQSSPPAQDTAQQQQDEVAALHKVILAAQQQVFLIPLSPSLPLIITNKLFYFS